MSTEVINLWKVPGFPHRGWTCIRVVDLNPDDGPSEEVDYETCRVCGQYPIRFVHTVVHDEWQDEVDVGCVCVEHLTDDYVNPKRREKELKKRAYARAQWLSKEWRVSAKGTLWIKQKGHHMTVFRSKPGDGWRCSFDGKFGGLTHPTVEAAKLSVFNRYMASMQRSKTVH